jgi:ketosteroid isomerase-like protein
MTPPVSIERLMRDLYAARVRGDLEAVCRSFSASAGFQIASASKKRPVALKATGVAEFRPLLRLLIKTFRLADFTILKMEIVGAQATVHWRVNVRSSITGTLVPTELIDIVEVRRGRIVNFNEVFVPR